MTEHRRAAASAGDKRGRILIQMRPRYFLIVAFAVGSVMAIAVGLAGETGIFDGVAAQIIAIVAGATGLLLAVGLLVSNVVQRWAVLVAYDDRLQLIYPFGIHRWMPSTTLRGDLASADLKAVTDTGPTRPMTPRLVRFALTVDGVERSFTAADSVLIPDYVERFKLWQSELRRDPTMTSHE